VEIFCACPFPVATLAWEPAASRASVTVCVKATFVLAPGVATLAPLQEPIRLEAPSADAPDVVPYKPRADIVLAGHAHAPGGAPTDSLLARVRVGAWRKSLSINGDRTWVPSFDGLRPSVAVPFRRMPLVYERAVRAGENLVGVDISQGAEQSRPLANIAAIADQGGETPGLAPIPFGFRVLHIGLGDAGILWASRAGVAAGPPPEAFDFRIFNAAPIEQQVDEIPPGVSMLLENLHPEFAQLETRLPHLVVKVFLRGPRDSASSEVAARCDTLSIDTDRGLAFAVWRAVFPAPEPEARLVVVAEAEGERIAASDVDHMLASVAPEPIYVEPALVRGAALELPAIADPIPLPEEEAEPPRKPTPLTPPAHDAATFEALPFRPLPTGFAMPEDTNGHTDVDADDEDAEVTPPRGHALPPDPAAFDRARMEAWRSGEPVGAVLASLGIARDAFEAHEEALRAEVEREAEEGGSEAAIAWLEALRRA
jgi:hypothetical protein